jgi:hypothetical protein
VLRYLGETAWSQERIVEEWSERGTRTVEANLSSAAKFLKGTELGQRFVFVFHPCSRAQEAIDVAVDRLGKRLPTVISKGPHMLIITGVEGGRVYFHDPAGTAVQNEDCGQFMEQVGEKPHLLLIHRKEECLGANGAA